MAQRRKDLPKAVQKENELGFEAGGKEGGIGPVTASKGAQSLKGQPGSFGAF